MVSILRIDENHFNGCAANAASQYINEAWKNSTEAIEYQNKGPETVDFIFAKVHTNEAF